MLVALPHRDCTLTATSSDLRAPKLCAINFELGRVTHRVGAFLTATTADPMTSCHFLRIGTAILLVADEAIIRLFEDRRLTSRTVGSAFIRSQICRAEFFCGRSKHTMAHKCNLVSLAGNLG